MRNHVKLPTIQNVAAGARCDVQLARGLTYDYIIFKLTNVTTADVKNFKVKVGTKNIIEVNSLQTLDKINKYYKRPESSGYFICWFYRPEMQTEEERAVFSLGTKDIGNLSLQFELDSGVTNPAIEAYAMQRTPANMGTVTKIREMPATFATSGIQEIANVPRSGDRISAIHLFKSDISNLEMEINVGAGPANLIDFPKGMLEVVQKAHGREPQTASATHVDLALLGKLNDFMPTMGLQELRLKPTIDTAGSINTVIEYAGGMSGA